MRRFYYLTLMIGFAMASPVAADAQSMSLRITNLSDRQRHEVVEASLDTIYQCLGMSQDSSLVVENALGQEMTYQKSHDGKLLLEVSLHPRGEVTYTVSKGRPSPFKSYVYGRVYRERLDDLTWENDRGIYRFYGPALQRTGEKSFGTDVWVKNTPELQVEERYRHHNWGWHQMDSLKKAGRPKEEAEKAFLNASFHLDHGNGMDCYAVGASLGCGAPALMEDGQLVFPYCYKTCKILDNGPLRFTAELTYGTTAAGITEHRLVALDKGAHFNRMTVWYDGISKPTALATGVVLHGTDHLILDQRYILYADPTDNPNVHQSQVYVATLYPEGVDETVMLKGKQNHGVGIVHQYQGSPYTYYFGSAWSNYDVRNLEHWQLVANDFLYNVTHQQDVKLQYILSDSAE